MEYKMGDIIKVEVVGSQPYGLFVKSVDDNTITGLIHISEISYGYVKDVNQVAKIGEVLETKVLSYDKNTKHLKLSMKALLERNRYQRIAMLNKEKKSRSRNFKDFTPLALQLPKWIEIEKEKEEVKK